MSFMDVLMSKIHRYVRVYSDILLLAIVTGMVIDALHDLTGN